MLNDAAASIPYPCSAVKKLALQSRTARFNLGDAVKSVRQSPSTPPVKLIPTRSPVNPPLVVDADNVFAFPPAPSTAM